MSKLFGFLMVLCCGLFLTGCPDCSKIKPFTDKAAVTFATMGDCQGVEAMQRDLIGACEKVGLCESNLQGAIADAVCPFAVDFFVKQGNNLKPEYKCKGGIIADKALAACKTIPY